MFGIGAALALLPSRIANAEGAAGSASWNAPDAVGLLRAVRAGARELPPVKSREVPPVWIDPRKDKPSLEEALWTLEHSPERHLYRKQPIQLAVGKQRAGGQLRTLVWHPESPIEVQVTDARGGWVERVAIIEHPVARAAYNLTAKRRAEEGLPWGGPPKTSAVGIPEAVELLAGMDGTSVLRSFDEGLRGIRRHYSPSR